MLSCEEGRTLDGLPSHFQKQLRSKLEPFGLAKATDPYYDGVRPAPRMKTKTKTKKKEAEPLAAHQTGTQ
jgi:hypothetical protein